MLRPLTLIALALPCLLAATGCTLLKQQDKPVPNAAMQMAGTAEEFRVTSEAERNNSVVLDIIGSKTPAKVIPLPADGQPVYISTLLKQSGLIEEYPRMNAKLYRNSNDTLNGIRMGVRFLPKSNQVAPEYDYVLRAGDRLEVVEVDVNPLESLTDIFSSSGGRKLVRY
jgi:hypothetical protein